MTLRLFAAIAPPDPIAERLIPLQRGVPGAKWRPRDNFHITLRFFGDTPEPLAEDLDGELALVAEKTPPFELQLKGAGSFGDSNPHAIWIGVEPTPELSKLAADCERAARRVGIAPEKRKFMPHVTMAYLTRTDLDRVQAFVSRLALYRSEPFIVRDFALYSSQIRKSAPSLYRLEADYPLIG